MYQIDAPESGGARTACVLASPIFSHGLGTAQREAARIAAVGKPTVYILPIRNPRRQWVPPKKEVIMTIPLRAPRPRSGVIFRMWITRNGRRVYRPNGKPWPIHVRSR